MATELPTSMGIKQSSSLRLTMYVCMYVCMYAYALHNDEKLTKEAARIICDVI